MIGQCARHVLQLSTDDDDDVATPTTWDDRESMRQQVNVRNVRFLGEGKVEEDGTSLYTLGDVVPQSPSHNVNHIR